MNASTAKYKLDPGTYFVSSEDGRINYKNAKNSAWQTDISFWVTQKETDRVKIWFRRINHIFSVINGQLIEQTKPRQKIGYFHLKNNGSVIYNTKMGTDFDPQEFFPVIPANLTSQTEWKVTNALLEKEFTYTKKGPEENVLMLDSKFEGPIDRIHLRSSTQQIRFDLQKCLPIEISNQISEGYPVISTKESVVKLIRMEEVDEKTCLAIDKEFQLVLDATLDYEVFCNKLDKICTNVQNLIIQAKEVLVSTRYKLGLDLTKEILDGFIQMHEDNIDHMKWDFAEIIETKEMELAPFQLRTFEDKEKIINSADLRGKVIVLDFWHRDCSYCIKMMPSMKTVVNRFQTEIQQEKLAIYGVNTDNKQSDAMIVLNNMKLNYPNLIGSKKFATKCFVRSYPTVYVLNKQGIIKDVYKGAHIDFEDELTNSIRLLLQPQEANEG